MFSASERWRETNEEYEHYTDSGGKSGGQKEKLAYTILAASLVYHFGLKGQNDHPQSFRFVVIDEAFLKSSDESARFGLSLFQSLDLQLMIVTPLLKIPTISQFVSHVGWCISRWYEILPLKSLRKSGSYGRLLVMLKWSDAKAIQVKLEKRWVNRRILQHVLAQDDLFPLKISLKRLQNSDINTNFLKIFTWIKSLKEKSKQNLGHGYELVEKEIRHRQSGRNVIPTHAYRMRYVC